MRILKWFIGLFKRKDRVAVPEQPMLPSPTKVFDDGKFKVGDKVRITCKKRRESNFIYDGKVGEIIRIWDLKRNPWGNYVVVLPNLCQNGFLAEELEIVE